MKSGEGEAKGEDEELVFGAVKVRGGGNGSESGNTKRHHSSSEKVREGEANRGTILGERNQTTGDAASL